MSFSASFVLVIVLILVPNLLVVVEARALGKFEHGLLNREILPAADSKNDSISSYKGCAVVLDVERSWSMFNVFCFDHNFDLVLYRDDSRRIYLPFYGKILFGMLRKYQDPKVAYHSLVPMDRFAEGSVPKELRPRTPIRVGATPELRWLEGNASEILLQSVRDFLRERSSLKFEADDVTILNGYQKGFYQWMTVNYLLGNSGKKYTETVGIVDMDDNSVQMVYAISKKDDDVAPIVSVPGQDPYIKEVLLNDTRYYLHVHSYLNYGLLAARAEILRLSDNSGNPCVLNGFEFDGVYKYRGEEYNASASSSGSSFEGCSAQVLKIFKFKEAFNKPYNCTFNGNNLYASSHFFSEARQAGLVNGTGSFVDVGAADFEKEGKRACKIKNIEDAKSAYPAMSWSQLPYLCMDLVYQYTLLVHGFGLQEITLMNEHIDYRGTRVRTLWPLGSAIEAVFNIINHPNYERLMM